MRGLHRADHRGVPFPGYLPVLNAPPAAGSRAGTACSLRELTTALFPGLTRPRSRSLCTKVAAVLLPIFMHACSTRRRSSSCGGRPRGVHMPRRKSPCEFPKIYTHDTEIARMVCMDQLRYPASSASMNSTVIQQTTPLSVLSLRCIGPRFGSPVGSCWELQSCNTGWTRRLVSGHARQVSLAITAAANLLRRGDCF